MLIENGEIQMVHGKYLTMQMIESIWLTKKGEWFLNWDEGIDRDLIMGKKQVDEDTVRIILQDGLSQISENLVIDALSVSYEKADRKLFVSCVVRDKETNETMTVEGEL